MSEKFQPEVRKIHEGEILPPLSAAERAKEDYQKEKTLLEKRAFSLMQESERLEKQLSHQKRMSGPNDELIERTEDRLRAVQEDLADVQNHLEHTDRESHVVSGPTIIEGVASPANLLEDPEQKTS